MSAATPSNIPTPDVGTPKGHDVHMDTVHTEQSDEVWGEEVPDDSKPVFKDDQTLMKPESVILAAPSIYH